MITTNDYNDGYQHTNNNIITNNILFAKYPNQLPYYFIDKYIDSARAIGIIDSNYLVNTSTGVTTLVNFNYGANNFNYSFPAWKARAPFYDQHSHITPLVTPTLTTLNVDSYLRFEYNATGAPVTVYFNGFSWMDAKGTIFNNSITLQPYTSAPLIFVGISVAPTNIIMPTRKTIIIKQ